MNPILASVALSSLILLSACSQQQSANVVDRRDAFYGRNGWFEGGQAVARFSNDNRAVQSQDVAYKYKTTEHSYGVDASVEKVAVADLAPPAPVQSKPLAAPAAAQASPFQQASAPAASAPQSAQPAPFQQTTAEPTAQQQPAITTTTAAPVASLSQPAATESVAEMQPQTAASPINGASMAFRWPTNGQIISRFGPKTNGMSNDGVNIAAKEGSPIWAAADGEVAYVGSDLEGYGNLLIVRHADGWMTSYAHAREFLLKQGDEVVQGDVLGYVGNTGSVKTPQLHFSMREGKIPIDPESVLGQQLAQAKP